MNVEEDIAVFTARAIGDVRTINKQVYHLTKARLYILSGHLYQSSPATASKHVVQCHY